MKPVSEVIEYYENATKEEAIYDLYMDYVDLQQENQSLKDRIEKSIEVIESYNLGKYDYSVPPGGITDLLEILKGDKEC